MKQSLMAAIAATAIVLTSCSKKDDNLSGTFDGTEIAMGNGKVRSWMKTDETGKPSSVGFTLTDAALTGLPAGDSVEEAEYELQLPVKTYNTVFKHVVIDWNPHGHPPGPYLVPHFDFHFYTISSQERETIPVYEADSNSFKQYPDAAYLPAGYFNPGGGVPEMGTHWVDMNSPELQGKPFTETFIYGTYKGKVNFLEPMVALSFLQTVTSYERAVPRPSRVMESGYYPRKMRITHSGGNYTVSMEDMEWRDKN